MMFDERAVDPLDATPETSRVVIANYLCMTVTTIVIIARAGLNLKWKRKPGLDDLLLYLSLAACVTESVLIHDAVYRGLGTFIRPGNSAKLQRLSEIIYASDLFYLIAMFLAKLSVVRIVYRFASRAAIAKGKLLYLQISITLWAAFSIPAIAFQCGPPLPWLYIPARCVGSGALWYPVLVFCIVTDLWLSVCAWSSLPELHIGQKQRQLITGLFAMRAITCIFTVAEIALLSPALKDINQPRAMPNPTVLKSLVLNASIITAAIPLLNRTLAQYKAPPSAHAAIYPSEERGPTTPLEELKVPTVAVLPHPRKFDGLVKETEVISTPKIERDDFSFSFSSEFNKEIATAGSRV